MTSTLAGDATVARPRTTGHRSPQWWAVAAVPSAVAVVYTALTRGLTGDLHYVLAALRTGRAAGYSPSEVFTHRPYFYRWFVALLDRLAFFGSTAVREATMNVAGVLLAAAAAYVLHTALVRRVGAREAAVTAGATGLALALAPATTSSSRSGRPSSSRCSGRPPRSASGGPGRPHCSPRSRSASR